MWAVSQISEGRGIDSDDEEILMHIYQLIKARPRQASAVLPHPSRRRPFLFALTLYTTPVLPLKSLRLSWRDGLLCFCTPVSHHTVSLSDGCSCSARRLDCLTVKGLHRTSWRINYFIHRLLTAYLPSLYGFSWDVWMHLPFDNTDSFCFLSHPN